MDELGWLSSFVPSIQYANLLFGILCSEVYLIFLVYRLILLNKCIPKYRNTDLEKHDQSYLLLQQYNKFRTNNKNYNEEVVTFKLERQFQCLFEAILINETNFKLQYMHAISYNY